MRRVAKSNCVVNRFEDEMVWGTYVARVGAWLGRRRFGEGCPVAQNPERYFLRSDFSTPVPFFSPGDREELKDGLFFSLFFFWTKFAESNSRTNDASWAMGNSSNTGWGKVPIPASRRKFLKKFQVG
jgi:hypothetical protein